MKVLFVTDRVYATRDPNLNLVKSIVPYLGCECYFMGHDLQSHKVDEFCFEYTRDETVRQLYFSLANFPLWKKAVALLCHPRIVFWGAFKLFNIDLITLPYVRRIQKLDKKYRFDAIVSISAPFYTAKALARVKTGAKKVIMMFDPYGLHFQFGNPRTRRIEKRCFDAVDHVLVPKLLEPHYPDEKVQAFEFPAVVTTPPIVGPKLYNSSKINLAFIGSLYADIRSPEYLYELLRWLDDDKYHLTIVGGTYGVFPEEFHRKYSSIIDRYVTEVGKVSKAEALQYLWQADVLVNIGNLVENMLPSKVLEYISTGKPVLNITQIENCPSIPYFEKYGNAMSIYSKNPVSQEQLQQVRDFLEKRDMVTSDIIVEEFREATPEYVAQKLIDMVK